MYVHISWWSSEIPIIKKKSSKMFLMASKTELGKKACFFSHNAWKLLSDVRGCWFVLVVTTCIYLVLHLVLNFFFPSIANSPFWPITCRCFTVGWLNVRFLEGSLESILVSFSLTTPLFLFLWVRNTEFALRDFILHLEKHVLSI